MDKWRVGFNESMESLFLVIGGKVCRWARILWKIFFDCFYFISEVENS